jgi:O-antigen ligase
MHGSLEPYLAPVARYAKTLKWLAQAAFFTTLILIPVRLRITLIARPIDPIYSDYTDFLLYLPDIAMLATLTLWGFSLILSPRKLGFGPRHIWIPLAGLTLAGGLSILGSYDRALSTYHALRLVLLFTFYVFIVNEIRSVVWILIPVGLQVAIQSTVAIAQFIVQGSVGLQFLGEHSLNPAASGISIIQANGVRLLRAYGLTEHPNILGGCLAFGLLLLLSASLYAPTRSLLLAALLPGLIALLVTFSRSAWLAFAGGATCILAVLIRFQRPGVIRYFLTLASISLLLLLPFLLAYPGFFGARVDAGNSFSSNPVEEQSITERILLFKSALPILRDHLLTGVGLGASPVAMKDYYPNLPVAYQPPHFTLMDAALETGLTGAVFYLSLLVLPMVIFIMKYRSLAANPLTLASAGLLIAIAIVGLFDYYTWLFVPGRLWQWLAWGLWAAALRQVPSLSPTPIRVEPEGPIH